MSTPMYDPYTDTALSSRQPDIGCYWQAGCDSQRYPPLAQDTKCDTLIIGAGYTGLNCALELASYHQQEVLVVDALQPGWGCSGRNGGFVLRGTGRLGLSQLAARFGVETARLFHQEYGAAIERVNQLISEGNINCQAQSGGYYKIAHNAAMAKQMAQQAAYFQQQFSYPVQYLNRQQLQETAVNHQQAYAGIYAPDCYGVNPRALVQGYARLATEAGATIYGDTSVTRFVRSKTGFEVYTSQGRITANTLVLATNAYTAKGLYQPLTERCLPVLSSIIVTEPLNAQQLQQLNWQNHSIMMDTRTLKYYYRLLPDNRILFGGRGAITGKAAADPVYAKRLLTALKQCFKGLDSLNVHYQWSGWVGVSYDDLPRVCQAEPHLFYAAGYCGSGLSFSTLAGQRLAQLIVGKPLPALPIYQSPLPPFPLTKGRRLGQQLYYQWGRFKDHYL